MCKIYEGGLTLLSYKLPFKYKQGLHQPLAESLIVGFIFGPGAVNHFSEIQQNY
jgi:hypothetical protein